MRFAELKDCVKCGWDFIEQDWNIYHVALKELKDTDWESKIKLLHHTLEGLNILHGNNLVHGELHRRNILMGSGEPFSIAAKIDPGLTNDLILTSDSKTKKYFWFNSTFIPELWWSYEMTTEIEPFANQEHDTYLMIDVKFDSKMVSKLDVSMQDFDYSDAEDNNHFTLYELQDLLEDIKLENV
ncbi:hypothetical protein Glove_208g123 [Diversispora epigaea]|uniref:Serine-threonine/tyrosine-protein kinase catalytic domain-containing protein n=1 Tax=Diversispora epigaea TaxID=1348612 RepID=A0A397IIQ3_9GLOM|nr:hypothetical protein Glove_208g123 [Diversispora epigaea]